MGAINFGTLTRKSRLAIVNEAETEDEEFFYYYELEEVKKELRKHEFYYFSLVIDYGYYNGFYLRIGEENTRWIYNNSKEKAEVLKELTQIKNILSKFIKEGLVFGCYPGWVTSYKNEKETLKELKVIIKELKEEVKASYTQATAKRQNKNIFEIIKEAEAR